MQKCEVEPLEIPNPWKNVRHTPAGNRRGVPRNVWDSSGFIGVCTGFTGTRRNITVWRNHGFRELSVRSGGSPRVRESFMRGLKIDSEGFMFPRPKNLSPVWHNISDTRELALFIAEKENISRDRPQTAPSHPYPFLSPIPHPKSPLFFYFLIPVFFHP